MRASRELAERLADAGADVTYAEAQTAGHFDAFASEVGRAALQAFLRHIGLYEDGPDQSIRTKTTGERRPVGG